MTKGLAIIRQQINELDTNLLDLFGKRFELLGDISGIKAAEFGDQFIYIDPEREFTLLKKNIQVGLELGLPPGYTKQIWRTIISNANLHEQPNLAIYIPADTPRSLMHLIANYYPISSAYTFYNNITECSFANTDIVCISLQALKPEVFTHFNSFKMRVYHHEICKTTGESVLFFARVKNVYDAKDSSFLLYNKTSREIAFVDKAGYDVINKEGDLAVLGSSAPSL